MLFYTCQKEKNQMENPKVYKLKFYGTNYNIVLGKANYVNNGTLAVLMFVSTPKGKIKEDFGDLTQNIDDSDIFANAKDSQFIDTNNLPSDIIKWLEDNDIAYEENGIYGHSGYCVYPLVKFTQQALDWMIELK